MLGGAEAESRGASASAGAAPASVSAAPSAGAAPASVSAAPAGLGKEAAPLGTAALASQARLEAARAERSEVQKTQAELEIVRMAMFPQEAAGNIKKFIDDNSKEDHLAGTAEASNPWRAPSSDDKGCCSLM
jgi:hypothetical protein